MPVLPVPAVLSTTLPEVSQAWVERLRSLLEAPCPAVLTTYRKDGSAHTVPVWYRWTGEAFEVVIAKGDVKLRHLARDPRCVLVVFEAVRPFRGVEVRGVAELVEGDVTSARAVTRCCKRPCIRELLPSEQARLHAIYARLLAVEADGAAAELAHHCLASHDLPGALAASVRAAQESAAVLAPAETLRHLSSALRLWERVPDPAAVTGTDRIDLTLRAAEAAAAAGEERQAAALAQACRRDRRRDRRSRPGGASL